MQAVILAGGFGKRLKPLTDNIPKPMLTVGGVPILERQILWLKKQGAAEVVLAVGYKKDAIIDYFGDGSHLGVHIEYSFEREGEPLGTGGALRNAGELLHGEEFVFTYGDVMTDLDYGLLRRGLEHGRYVAAMAVVPLRSPFGIVEMGGRGEVQSFKEKPTLGEYWMNAGVFCFSTKILNILPVRGSLEAITLEVLASERRLKAVKYSDALWRSVDSHKDIEEAEKEFPFLVPASKNKIDVSMK